MKQAMSQTMDNGLMKGPLTQRSQSQNQGNYRGNNNRMRDLIVSNFIKKYMAAQDQPEGEVSTVYY